MDRSGRKNALTQPESSFCSVKYQFTLLSHPPCTRPDPPCNVCSTQAKHRASSYVFFLQCVRVSYIFTLLIPLVFAYIACDSLISQYLEAETRVTIMMMIMEERLFWENKDLVSLPMHGKEYLWCFVLLFCCHGTIYCQLSQCLVMFHLYEKMGHDTYRNTDWRLLGEDWRRKLLQLQSNPPLHCI